MSLRIDARAARQTLALWDETALRAAETHWAARLPAHGLMQRAGEAAARLLRARWPHARRVLVLAGPGHNGGDGLAAAAWLARQAHGPRLQVVLVGCGDPAQWAPARRPAGWCWAFEQARAAGLQPLPWQEIDPQALLGDSDVVLDALLGLGLREAPRAQLAAAVESLAAAPARPPVLAIDLPSGLSGASGAAPGALVRADVTLAMLGLQPGHVTGPDTDACGELWLDGLGADPRATDLAPVALWGGADDALRALPAPEQAAHKGTRGDVRVFGGGAGMAGALWLAARAALVLGAGRVFAAGFDPHVAGLDPCYPEIMSREPEQLLEQARGSAGARACLVFGPGSGQSHQALRCLVELLPLEQPLVIDADGLNLLAAQPHDGSAWQALRARSAPTWLTPHPTEAGRLLGVDTATIQADRLGAARRLHDLSGARIVLKGAGSVVLGPHAQAWIN
ncbi:MAG: NAD(P)H-hydrate epimerase, partial [Betaproteobacteria bacterium]|nr:NAD(P)H-hydrate epimerase [Betaproteobacteria bacterium]